MVYIYFIKMFFLSNDTIGNHTLPNYYIMELLIEFTLYHFYSGISFILHTPQFTTDTAVPFQLKALYYVKILLVKRSKHSKIEITIGVHSPL